MVGFGRSATILYCILFWVSLFWDQLRFKEINKTAIDWQNNMTNTHLKDYIPLHRSHRAFFSFHDNEKNMSTWTECNSQRGADSFCFISMVSRENSSLRAYITQISSESVTQYISHRQEETTTSSLSKLQRLTKQVLSEQRTIQDPPVSLISRLYFHSSFTPCYRHSILRSFEL